MTELNWEIKLNGRGVVGRVLSHSALMKGGTLSFMMSDQPLKFQTFCLKRLYYFLEIVLSYLATLQILLSWTPNLFLGTYLLI